MKRFFIFIFFILLVSVDSKKNPVKATEFSISANQSNNDGWVEIGEVPMFKKTGRLISTSAEGIFWDYVKLYYKYINGYGRILRVYYQGCYYTINKLSGRPEYLYKNDGTKYGKLIGIVHYYFNDGDEVFYISFNPQ